MDFTEEVIDDLKRYRLAYEETTKVLLERDLQFATLNEKYHAARLYAIELVRYMTSANDILPDFMKAAMIVDDEIKTIIDSKNLKDGGDHNGQRETGTTP